MIYKMLEIEEFSEKQKDVTVKSHLFILNEKGTHHVLVSDTVSATIHISS